jgi:hypothetical protein
VSEHPQTVAVDFDGVLHAYSEGWRDGSIYDPPVPGSVEALTDLTRRVAVFVHTTRDPMNTAAWLMHHFPLAFVVEQQIEPGLVRRIGFGRDSNEQPVAMVLGEQPEPSVFWNDREHVLVTNRKLPAVAYVDDRAVKFFNWRQTMHELDNVLGPTTASRR